MAIFVSSKIVKSNFNVKKSVGPDIFNIAEGSKAVNIVGKQLDGDVITLTGKAADYAINASGNAVALRFLNEAGKFVTVKFSIKDLGSVTLAFADGGFEVDNLLGKGKIAIGGELVGSKPLSIESYLDLDGEGSDGGAFLNPALSKTALDHINANPVFTSASTITLNEDSVFYGKLTATDADGDNLTYSLANDVESQHGSIDFSNNGSYAYHANANFHGTDSFVVNVSDGKGGITQQTISVTVNAVNDLPDAQPDALNVFEDGALSAGTVADSDVDGDTLTYALAATQAPVPGLTFNSNGSFLFDPANAAYQSIAAGVTQPVEVSYTVTDGKSTPVLSKLTINITGTNDLPVFTSATTLTVLEDNVFSGQLNATDVDKNDLVYAVATAASHGAVELGEAGSYTYTPGLNFSGTDSFVVSVFDGVATVKQTITVTVSEGDLVYSLTDGVDVLTGQGVRNTFQETAPGQFSQDDIISGGQFDASDSEVSDDDTLLLRSSTVSDEQFKNTTGIERLVVNSDNGTGNDVVTLGKLASLAGIHYVETRGGDDVIDVSAMKSSDAIVVDAGAGSDTLVLSGHLGDVSVELGAESNIINGNTTVIGFENVDASGYLDSGLYISANDAGSVIVGSAQADTLVGSIGDDDITSGGGMDMISAGDGNDTVRLSTSDLLIEGLVVDGGADEDTLVVSGLNPVSGYGIVLGGTQFAGIENLDASGVKDAGIDVTANDAGSKIKATVLDDVITGSIGNDVIRGNLGADQIAGGDGVNTFVYVGALNAAANALYQGYTGDVVVDSSVTLDVSSVVSLADLTTIKPVSDVVAGETLDSTPADYVVIFGDVDLTLLNAGGPILGTIVVNSTLRISYSQIIDKQTFIIGGLIDQEQTPSKVIITDLPVGDAGMVPTAVLDFLNLAGVETLVLEGADGQSLVNTPIALPAGYVADVFVSVAGEESPATPGEDFIVAEPVAAPEAYVLVSDDGLFLNGTDSVTADQVSSDTSITSIHVGILRSNDVSLKVGSQVTSLELVNGEGEDLEADFSIERVNDTDHDVITIKTSPATADSNFEYDVEDGLISLNDEETIIIDTGSAVQGTDGYIKKSDLYIDDLYVASLNTLTIKGDGNVDLEGLHFGTKVRTVTIDASGSTGDIDIEAGSDYSTTVASISYTGSSGANSVRGTDNDDTITITSDSEDNYVNAQGGDDTITFTGDGYNIYYGIELSGYDGNDTITATANLSDNNLEGSIQVRLFGGDGADTLMVSGTAPAYIDGGAGADVLTGGSGATTFYFDMGDSVYSAQNDPALFDTVNGFTVGTDKLEIVNGGNIQFVQNISAVSSVSSVSDMDQLLLVNKGGTYAGAIGAPSNPDALQFKIGSDSYLLVDADNNDLIGADDLFIKLVGVTTNLAETDFIYPYG